MSLLKIRNIPVASFIVPLLDAWISDYYLTAYDDNATNGADETKTGCYVLDPGDYWFSIGDNAHDALNNILCGRGATGMTDEKGNAVSGDAAKAVKITWASLDNRTWAVSPYTRDWSQR